MIKINEVNKMKFDLNEALERKYFKKLTEATKKCIEVVACYNDDDGYDQAAWFGLPAGMGFDDLEEWLYDSGNIYVEIEKQSAKYVDTVYTKIDMLAVIDFWRLKFHNF